MMNGMTARITSTTSTVMRAPLSPWETELKMAAGRPAMMLAKMMSDMPLPTPRWVMTSPSHMMIMAPASMVTTTMTSMSHSGAGMPVKLMP